MLLFIFALSDPTGITAIFPFSVLCHTAAVHLRRQRRGGALSADGLFGEVLSAVLSSP